MITIAYLLLFACLTLTVSVCWPDIRTTRITPFMVFSACEFIMVWPAPILAAQHGDPLGLPALLLQATSHIAAIGGYLALTKLRSGKAVAKAELQRPMSLDATAGRYAIAVVIAAAGLAWLSWWYLRGLPPVVESVLTLVRSGSASAAAEVWATRRFEITKAGYFGASYRADGLAAEVLQAGWSMIAATALGVWLATRDRRWAVAAAALASLDLVLIGGVERLRLMLVGGFVIVMLSHSGRASKTRLTWLGAAAVLVFFLSSLLSTQSTALVLGEGDPVGTRLRLAAERVTVGYSATNLEVMHFIDDGLLQPQLGMVHFSKFILALPGPAPIDVPVFAYTLTELRGSEDPTAFTSMTNFGVLYADFGLVGPIAGYFMIGMLAGYMENVVFRSRREPVIFASWAYVTILFYDLSIGSLPSALSVVPVIFVLYAGLRLMLQSRLRRPTTLTDSYTSRSVRHRTT